MEPLDGGTPFPKTGKIDSTGELLHVNHSGRLLPLLFSNQCTVGLCSSRPMS